MFGLSFSVWGSAGENHVILVGVEKLLCVEMPPGFCEHIPGEGSPQLQDRLSWATVFR